MPTIFTHALVGVGLAKVCASRSMPPLYWGLAAAISALPDLDVLTFSFGIPYGARFGHRGFSHSFSCALLTSLVVALLSFQHLNGRWWLLWGIFFLIMASHGVLDAFTNGGLGIALFSPFDDTRYFFPWQPVEVSPLGRGFFSRRGLDALLSEVIWIWVPLGVLAGGVMLVRYFTAEGAAKL